MFKEIAAWSNLDFKVMSEDFQGVVDGEKLRKQRKDDSFTFNEYHKLDEINKFMDDIQAANPEIASVFTVGESFEGRTIKGIKITRDDKNPAIFIEANIHAREWISSATAVWIINEVITPSQPDWKEIAESVTWYVVPVTNPDGYEYTWSTNRLWRKTRSTHNLLCRGVDPNRNFAYNWRGELDSIDLNYFAEVSYFSWWIFKRRLLRHLLRAYCVFGKGNEITDGLLLDNRQPD
jgi:murein tripeptide amidase MpaA